MENGIKIKNISLIKASMFLSITMLGLKFISFLRDIMLAKYFGATVESDAFLVSLTVLTIFTTLITSPLAASFIPIATDIYIGKGKEEFSKFIGASYTLAFFAGIVITLITYFFLDVLIRVIAPGFSAEGTNLIYILVIIQLPVITISILNGINRGNLQMINRFNFAQALNSLGILFTIVYFLFSKDNSTIQGTALAFTLGSIISVFMGYYVIFREGIFPKFSFVIITPEIKKMLQMMIMFAIASGVREINIIVDKAIGSLLPTGSITMMSYASKMTVTEVGLVSVAISTVAFAQISKLTSLGDKNELKKTFVNAINIVNTLIFPMVILTIVLRFEIINLLFGRGEFTQENVQKTANIMGFYAIGMIGFGMQDVLTRTFHAFKIAKYTLVSSILLVFSNVTLSIILYKPFGPYGIAFASSFSVLLIIVPLFYLCNRYLIPLKGEGLIKETTKIAFASITCGMVAYLFNNILLLNSNPMIKLFILTSISISTYIVIGYMLKIIVINDIIKSVLKKK